MPADYTSRSTDRHCL